MTTEQVRLEFEGEDAEDFRLVKERLGLKLNTEVVRFLIKKEAEQIRATVPEGADC